jgi:hypothetical protein
MGDRLVTLPPALVAAQQKIDTISLLVTIGCFAYPARWQPTELARDLTVRFVTESEISWSDITAWLADVGIVPKDLSQLVSEFNAGNREPLHMELMTGNDQGAMELLEIANAALLVDQVTGRQLPAGPCYLLRVGYNSDDGTAYYYPSLPGYGNTPAKIAWSSMAATQIQAAIAIAQPRPQLDASAFEEPLHIMEQALLTAAQAHAQIKSQLGLAASADGTQPV